jgi:transposase InsO family protein
MDLLGPLPSLAAGYSYIFTAIDRSARCLEAIPLKDMAAVSCTDALIAGWISRFGSPSVIILDRGTQFTSSIWDALCSNLGVTHNTTTAYHPRSNGLVERAHRHPLGWWTLSGHIIFPGSCWVSERLLKMKATSHQQRLVYGTPLMLPGKFLDSREPPATDFLEHMRPTPTSIPTRPLPPQTS